MHETQYRYGLGHSVEVEDTYRSDKWRSWDKDGTGPRIVPTWPGEAGAVLIKWRIVSASVPLQQNHRSKELLTRLRSTLIFNTRTSKGVQFSCLVACSISSRRRRPN